MRQWLHIKLIWNCWAKFHCLNFNKQNRKTFKFLLCLTYVTASLASLLKKKLSIFHSYFEMGGVLSNPSSLSLFTVRRPKLSMFTMISPITPFFLSIFPKLFAFIIISPVSLLHLACLWISSFAFLRIQWIWQKCLLQTIWKFFVPLKLSKLTSGLWSLT